jgi:hypothetical protein
MPQCRGDAPDRRLSVSPPHLTTFKSTAQPEWAPWQCLYFRLDPQGRRSLRPTFGLATPGPCGQSRSQLGPPLPAFELFLPEAQPLVLSPEALIRCVGLALTCADMRVPLRQLLFGSARED